MGEGEGIVLTLFGFGMIVTFMYLIMTKRLSPVVALIFVPISFALAAGFEVSKVGAMMLEGINTLAPTGIMLMFAILYFGVMIDVGLFDPVVRRILQAVGGDPLKVTMGAAMLAALVSLDGDGSTTYMITVASLLPLYKRLGMNPLNLTCVTMLAGGVMNLTPWGGPLARAASALQVDPSDVFLSMVPVMGVGVAGVFGLAWILGRAERRCLGVIAIGEHASVGAGEARPSRQTKLFWFNALLTAALMAALIAGVLPIPVLFMVGFALALVVNYPSVEEQRRRMAEHAPNAIAVVSLIFAAGIFTGILSGTGMVEAMSKSFLAVIPGSWGPCLASITALASMPLTFFMSNDAFYFGALPVLSEAANAYGISDLEMARASLIGQPIHLLSPLVPSTYLLVGLAGVEFGDHQRFTLKWAAAICMLMLASSLVLGAFPLTAAL
jgi:CitMHS family citrate-Mg2+:H+ or citrate-Ca2+:H+ symporter